MKRFGRDFDTLQNSLYYLHVKELKKHCEKRALSTKGKKVILIARLIHFLKTGEKINQPDYPATSKARGQKKHELKASSLMLKGSYKNDLKTRIFFKKLIGEHFHFTAFGIDWLEERWMEGNPPTYQEFADKWITEYELRKAQGSTPKKEWAYINFVKSYIHQNPNAPRDEIICNWERERLKHRMVINRFLQDHE